MTNSIYSRLAPAVMLLVIGLGAANWYHAPDQAQRWAVGMFFLPVAWILMKLAKPAQASTPAAAHARREVYGAMTAAGVLLAVSMAVVLAERAGGPTSVLSDRAMGVFMGGLLIIMGNYLPKRLTPLSQSDCDPAQAQSMRRFAGWAFVLGGIVYTVAWLVLPKDQAGTVAITAGITSVVLVIGRLAWTSARGKGN